MMREKICPLMGAFETLLSGSQRDLVFEAVFPYQRGPAPTLRSQQMKRKAECELAQSAEGLKKIWDFFPPVPAGESMDHCSYHPPCGLTARGEKAPQVARGYPCFAEARNSGLVRMGKL